MFPMRQVWEASGFNAEGIALIQVAKSPINILLPLTWLMLETSFLPWTARPRNAQFICTGRETKW